MLEIGARKNAVMEGNILVATIYYTSWSVICLPLCFSVYFHTKKHLEYLIYVGVICYFIGYLSSWLEMSVALGFIPTYFYFGLINQLYSWDRKAHFNLFLYIMDVIIFVIIIINQCQPRCYLIKIM